jgi:predicted kinase
MTEEHTAPLFLLTGIMASGKSTVAEALAERFPRSVHLRGDVFRRMIVRGQAEMNSAELSGEAVAQLELRYHLATTAALQYQQAGFTVVYQDIVVGSHLKQIIAGLETTPLYVIVLCPSAETVAARAAARSKGGYTPEFTPAMFDSALRQETPRLGLWLDSTALSVEETVAEILARLGEARVR